MNSTRATSCWRPRKSFAKRHAPGRRRGCGHRGTSYTLSRASRSSPRPRRSHESIAEDPVVLVLDPLSFDSTLTEHREGLLAGGEVLENLVEAPVVEGAPLIG